MLRQQQRQALEKVLGPASAMPAQTTTTDALSHVEAAQFGKVQVKWYESPMLAAQPPGSGPLLLLLHEFFDALPVQQFQASFSFTAMTFMDFSTFR